MHVNVAKEVATLGAMNVGELRVRYAEVFGEPARTGHKVWLVRRIIWRMQALAEGDLSERARKRAAELANDAGPAVDSSEIFSRLIVQHGFHFEQPGAG